MIPLRDENPSQRFPFITVSLITANVLAFLYQMSLGSAVEQFIYQFGILPLEVSQGTNLGYSQAISPYFSVLTSMFLHGGILHLVGNMWFLWIFGDNIEDFLGSIGFLLFYLLTGVAAALVHIFFNPDSTIPTIGASGAISGVLGAYMLLHPSIRIRTLVTLGFFWDILYVPAVFFLGMWFLMQFLGGFGPATGVAYGAHIGGFVAGAFLILLFTRRRPRQYFYRYESRRQPRWRHFY